MDDMAGSLIRNDREECKLKFCEAYNAWMSEKKRVALYLNDNGDIVAPVPYGSFKPLDRAWDDYVKARDQWLSFKW